MPLRNADAWFDWINSYDPPPDVRHRVGSWINEMIDAPWLAPSIPLPDISNQPVYEVRQAVVPDSQETQVYYLHVYADDGVSLLWVGPGGDWPYE